MTNVLITGDSHAARLWRSLRKTETTNPFERDGNRIQVQSIGPGGKMKGQFFENRGDYVEFVRPELRQRVERLPAENSDIELVGLSGPLLTIWGWSRDWSKSAPIGIGSGAYVSRGVMQSIFQSESRYMFELVEILGKSVKVFVIEPPGPFRHHPAVDRNGPERVIQIYKMYREYVMGWLTSHAVPVIEVPAECFDSDGFTRAEFRSEDPDDNHHGNERFGHIMSEKCLSFVKASSRE